MFLIQYRQILWQVNIISTTVGKTMNYTTMVVTSSNRNSHLWLGCIDLKAGGIYDLFLTTTDNSANR